MGIVVRDVTPNGFRSQHVIRVLNDKKKQGCAQAMLWACLPPWRTVDLRAEDKASGQNLEDNVDTAWGQDRKEDVCRFQLCMTFGLYDQCGR